MGLAQPSPALLLSARRHTLHEAEQCLTPRPRAADRLPNAIVKSEPVAGYQQRAFTRGDGPCRTIRRGLHLRKCRRDLRRDLAVGGHATAPDRRHVEAHSDSSFGSRFKNNELPRAFVFAVAERQRRGVKEVKRTSAVGSCMKSGDDIGNRGKPPRAKVTASWVRPSDVNDAQLGSILIGCKVTVPADRPGPVEWCGVTLPCRCGSDQRCGAIAVDG